MKQTFLLGDSDMKKAVGLVELFSKIGNDKLDYQILSQALTRIQTKNGVQHITFITDQISEAGKVPEVGLVVWIDPLALENAISDLGLNE